MEVFLQDQLTFVGGFGAVRVPNEKSGNDRGIPSHIHNLGLTLKLFLPYFALYENRLDIWRRDVPWSSVKQLRSVAETEFTVDDVFDHFINTFGSGEISDKGAGAHSKSEKIKQAFAPRVDFFVCVQQQDAGTILQYRKIPLPW